MTHSDTEPGRDLSYVRGDIRPLLEITIGTALSRTAHAEPDREALVDVASGSRWTYRQLFGDVERVAIGLLRLGIEPGDRIGIWAPNVPEWVITQFAAAACGAVLVTVNPTFRQHELDYVVEQSGLRMIVATAGNAGTDYVAMLDRARTNCAQLEHVVIIGSADWAALMRTPTQQERDRLTEVADRLGADDPINIQYTSGTTGHPKDATLSHRNILNNGYNVGQSLGYSRHDRICIPVPFYHCFGMVMGNLAAITHAATMVIPAPRFDPAATLSAVAQERCTSLYGVPTMFIAALALPDFADYDLSLLRTGIMAGSPCPRDVMQRVLSDMHMPEVSICYGMTETSPVSTQTSVDDSLKQRVGTVGRVGPNLELKVVDAATRETVRRGEVGELCTRGYSVMLGYWNDPVKTKEAIDAERWMHTGDLATIDDDGYVRITGRIKDMVIRGGENIYPREVEEFLHNHPDILDAQVIGVPDEKYGEELMAWIRLRPSAPDLTPESLREFARDRIAHHKVPRHLRIVHDYPMTVTGKIRKDEMRRLETSLRTATAVVPAEAT